MSKYAGCQLGSVVVVDWRGGSSDSLWTKYQPHSRDVTRLAFAPWKLVLHSLKQGLPSLN